MKVRQLMGRALDASPEELQFRARQFVYIRECSLACRFGLDLFSTDAHLRSLGLGESDLGPWLASRENSWFVTTERRPSLRARMEENPLEARRIIKRADLIVRGKMPIFTHEPVLFTGADRWRKDHISGVVAPELCWTDIAYLDFAVVGDSKHVWEPNRFPFVYWLGPAYVMTGDERYARAFCDLFNDWDAQNQYPWGVNFASALEVSLRSYAWVWALDFFRPVLARDTETLSRLLRALWIGLQHVEANLSYFFAPNTHLTGEAFALYACGAARLDFAESRRWRELGESILALEARRQFHRDGTHRELSSCYHLYSADFYTQAALISRRTGHAIDGRVVECAQVLIRRLAELAQKDLRLPQFGDCDGGRLTWFEFHPLDAAPTLFAAAHELGVVFNTDQRAPVGYNVWMSVSPDDDRIRVALSTGARETIHTRVGQGMDAEPMDSGIVVYKNAARDYLLVRSGSFGYLDCGHSHDAPTGFLLTLAGEELIVDSGTGAYTQSAEIRNTYRSAIGKNTLLVNGVGPSAPGASWFTWERKTEAQISCARQVEGGYYFKGSHKGFSSALGHSVEVRREIILLNDGVCVILDSWTAERAIDVTLCLTLAPTLDVSTAGRLIAQADGRAFHYLSRPELFSAEKALTENSSAETASDIRYTATVEKGPYSPGYGVMGETNVLMARPRAARSGALYTILSRIGPILFSGERGRFCVGEEGAERELSVDLSGKIRFTGPKVGPRRVAPVEFAR